MRNTHKRGNVVFLYTVTICLACLFAFQAKGMIQPGGNITLKANNIALVEVFRSIYKQTRLKVTYSNLMFNDKETVSVHFNNTPVQDVMSFLLKGKDVSFEFAENLIIISKKDKKSTNVMPADTLINVIPSVNGKVADGDGKPIPGATVWIKDTELGTTTDSDGNFQLIGLKRNASIVISSIGFETRELAVKGASVFVKLNLLVSGLDEAVVIAYGTTTQRLSTGNVSSVKASEIEKQPVNNPLLALQGRVPGLFVTQSTGLSGGAVSVQIRGQNSINSGNDPLYIIDGVPFTSQLLPNLSGTILQGQNLITGGNPLSFINPMDIESISVLKDADATAIYGSRGANGVILITTKKGEAAKTKVNFNLSTGIGKVSRNLELLNTQQYLEMRKEAFQNDGETPAPGNAPDLLLWDTTRYTDWQKAMIGGTAHYTDLQASLSGGNVITQYLISANYHRESTVFPGSFFDQKGSVHLNLSNNSNNQRFKSTFSASYLVDDNRLPNYDLTGSVYLSPNAPDPYNEDGSLNWANSTWPGFDNPYAATMRDYKARTTNLVSNLELGYRLAGGLLLKSSFGYTNLQIDEVSTFPLQAADPAFTKTGRASFADNKIRSWIIEPQLIYTRNIKNLKLEALIGTTFQQSTSDGQILEASGYNSDLLLENVQAAPMVAVSSLTRSVYKYNAVFARINFNLTNCYVLNLTGRRDGSSRFGANNKFHNFGSIGAAWIFSNEGFVKRSRSVISFGKLRTSFGTTGNDQIGDYRFYDLYSPYQFSYQGTIGLNPSNLYNPDLAWEETKKWELAIDLGLFKDRIMLNTSYYRNRSSNQLLSYILPGATGFTSISANFPATVQNSGWEIALNTINIKSAALTWSSSLNVTIPENKLISFPDLESSPYRYDLIIGEPIGTRKMFRFAGVNDSSGVYTFLDSKGNHTYNPLFGDDETAPINTVPKFYGGITNSLSYKGIQLDFTFQFVKQSGTNHLFRRAQAPGTFGYNSTSEVLERWRAPGDDTHIQKFTQNATTPAYAAYSPYAVNSDEAFTDASFIRLKNASLSYHLPHRLINKLHLQNCRVYVQGQNLWTFTSFKGLDPENTMFTAVPPLRVLTLGVQVGL